MKYEFTKSNFVQVTAETKQENVELMALECSPSNTTLKEKRKYSKRAPKGLTLEKKAQLEILRSQLTSIQVGTSGFITTEQSRVVRNFTSLAHRYILQHYEGQNVKVKTKKVFGGYQIAVMRRALV